MTTLLEHFRQYYATWDEVYDDMGQEDPTKGKFTWTRDGHVVKVVIP